LYHFQNPFFIKIKNSLKIESLFLSRIHRMVAAG
jgi:hypothetical protein